MIKRTRLVNLMRELIRINSENPPGREKQIAEFIGSYLKKLRVETEIIEFSKGRSNLLAYVEGKGRHTLLVTPHLDTVPAGKSWKIDPFSAEVINNRIYGLGATDCKCNIACFLEALNSILEKGATLSYNLIFAATADEESGSRFGLLPLLEKKIINPDAALVLDADDFHIIITQKGLLHVKVSIKGKKAHGAYPHLGENAINIMAKFINDTERFSFHRKRSSYLSGPTVNIGTVRGGDKVNVVADWCVCEADFRFLPGTKHGEILNIIKKNLRKYTRKFKVEIEELQEPYLVSQKEHLVLILKEAFIKAGIKPLIKGSEGATVLTFFKKYGVPAIATGFGVSECAHTADEYVKIDNICKGAKALEQFLLTYKN